jgi:hypothetical protein
MNETSDFKLTCSPVFSILFGNLRLDDNSNGFDISATLNVNVSFLVQQIALSDSFPLIIKLESVFFILCLRENFKRQISTYFY